MHLFFYGEDTYRLQEKLKALKGRYLASSSTADLNFVVLEGTSSWDEIFKELCAMPFLADKRLVILKNFLSAAKDEPKQKLADFLSQIPESTILIIAQEEEFDHRQKLYKALNQPKTAEEFTYLIGPALTNWVRATVAEAAAKIEPAAINLLISYLGSDLYRLKLELEKLVAYVDDRAITAADVEKLVRSESSDSVFSFIDALGQNSKAQAAKLLHALLDSGETELYLLGMIVYQFRNLIIVQSLVNESKSPAEIATAAKMHPFVVKKSIACLRYFSEKRLHEIYEYLLEKDLQLKTGQLDPATALDLLVAEL